MDKMFVISLPIWRWRPLLLMMTPEVAAVTEVLSELPMDCTFDDGMIDGAST